MGEANNMCEVCGSGNGRCGRCGNMCGYRGNHILRWILGIIIITWIFCIGMRFGELKASLDQSYYGHGYRYMPMMYGAQGVWNDGNVTYTTSSVPATMMTGIKGGSVQVIKGN